MVGITRCLYGMSMLASAVVGKVVIGEEREWTKEEYESGEVHEAGMAWKMQHWAKQEAAGLMNSANYPELGPAPCVNGFAEAVAGDRNNTFRCQNFDLMHFLSWEALGDPAAEGSSSWGWTSADGREFVAAGSFSGTAFIEITAEGKMEYLGRLPAYSVGSIWREIRAIGDYIVVGSEARDHGIQVFDMKKLLTLSPASPRIFTQADLTSWTRQLLPLGRAHNVVVNPELNYFVAVGAQPRNDPICRSGLNFFDFTDPSNPVSLGCAAADGYVHDAECLVYRGPDSRYQGWDICYGYNEDTLTIYDARNKANVTNIISRVTYPGARYIHQGAVLDVNNQEYIVLDDELDETGRSGVAANGFATTYIVDIRRLDAPVVTGSYQMRHRAIDHNQYIWNGQNYQSSYGAGMRVFDVSSIPSDPTGAGVCETGFFDIYPEDDFAVGGGQTQFQGSWSSFADFASGYAFISSIERGGFIVRQTSRTCRPTPTPVCNADNCLRALRATTIPGRLGESQNLCRTVTNNPTTAPTSLPRFARDGCQGDTAARVSSACACLPATETLVNPAKH